MITIFHLYIQCLTGNTMHYHAHANTNLLDTQVFDLHPTPSAQL